MSPPDAGRVLVTGASGFIGSAILRQCVASGLPCAAFSRRRSNLDGVTAHTGDVGDPVAVHRAMAGARIVIHAAGLAHRRAGRTAHAFERVNVAGTRVVAAAAATAGVQRLVLLSSAAVYGRRSDRPDEGTAPNPEGPYGASKLLAEGAASAVCETAGMALTILRPATVAGPGDPGSVAALAALIGRRRFFWVGDGSHLKTVIDVDDLASACLRAAQEHRAGCTVYNVGGWTVSMREIVETLAEALDVPVTRVTVPAVLARAASALVAPASRVPAIGWARGRLAAWLSDDVYDASRFTARFGPAGRVPWRDTLAREADWLQAQWRTGRAT